MSIVRKRSRSTSLDVAALTGVSQSVVSRAFTPGSNIAKETRKKVLEAAGKLNYVPNSIARSLITKRTDIVALILGNLANPFYVEVLHAFSRRLQEQGRQLLTFTLEPGADSDEPILQMLKYQVDGVILTAAQLSTRMTHLCHDRGIPIVLFNRYIPGSDSSVVRCDNAAGGRQIAEAFLAAGAKSFAMITGDLTGTTSQERARGFVERLLEDGLRRNDIAEIEGKSSYEGAFNATLQLFRDKTRPRPEALFGINDIMAMGAMDALRYRLGLRIPEEIMVAGFDDIIEARRAPYQLTTVRQPINRMVEETLSILNLDDPTLPIVRGVERPIKGRLMWRNTIPVPQSYRRDSQEKDEPSSK